MATSETKDEAKRHVDLEIKDAQLIFTKVWRTLEDEHDRGEKTFPREIIWLGGAPGAGKGTNSPFIQETRGIVAEPIVVSSLLNTPEAKAIKEAGGLVGDAQVLEILLRELLKPEYDRGVIVDGFPRTPVQVECLKLFYHKMIALRDEFRGSALAGQFGLPLFHIVLLFVGQKESVERQLKRGQWIREHNEQVRESGVGKLQEERATDLDPEAAKRRYRVFKETTFHALQSLRKIFHFHFIDATDTVEVVQERIEDEFQYQSSLELDHDTFDRIRHIPLSQELVMYARQDLVRRLDEYERDHSGLFAQVVHTIQERFVPIIERHAITGQAIVNSENPLFDNPQALAMIIDVFSERGYQAVVDVNIVDVPSEIDPRTNRINCRQKRVYRFHIIFETHPIRRGHHH